MKSIKSLWRLKPFIRPYLGLLALAGALALPLAALRISPVALVKYLLDDLLLTHDTNKLYLFPVAIVGIYAINFVIRFAHYYLIRVITIRVNQDLKKALFHHVLGLSADYFSDKNTGHLISRVGSDPNYIDGAVSSLNVMIREPITFIGLLIYAITLNWKLTLITLTIFPLLAWVFSATGQYVKKTMASIAEENSRVFSNLQEAFSGIRIVKIFRLENYLINKFDDKLKKFAQHCLKTSVAEEASHPMIEFLTSFAIAAVVFYGGGLVLTQQMTTGDLLAFFVAFALMMDPIRRLNEINIKINQAAGAMDRISEVFSLKSNLYQTPTPIAVNTFYDRIRLESVEFHYPDTPERKILSEVSFEIPKGKIIALVGQSGSGKSSLVGLISRIFDVTGGKISLDGIDIRDIHLDQLRSLIAVVSQDIFLFNDTIRENILCGNLEATDEQIVKAAEYAYALPFIEKLPNGFKTMIGERGVKLSGGERQRLSIARAFLTDAPILILDEATSNLDTASERAVQDALERLMQNKTTLVIAHRLSTIRNADQIIVLKEGKIVESGHHDQLEHLNGEYAFLHRMNR